MTPDTTDTTTDRTRTEAPPPALHWVVRAGLRAQPVITMRCATRAQRAAALLRCMTVLDGHEGAFVEVDERVGSMVLKTARRSVERGEWSGTQEDDAWDDDSHPAATALLAIFEGEEECDG